MGRKSKAAAPKPYDNAESSEGDVLVRAASSALSLPLADARRFVGYLGFGPVSGEGGGRGALLKATKAAARAAVQQAPPAERRRALAQLDAVFAAAEAPPKGNEALKPAAEGAETHLGAFKGGQKNILRLDTRSPAAHSSLAAGLATAARLAAADAAAGGGKRSGGSGDAAGSALAARRGAAEREARALEVRRRASPKSTSRAAGESKSLHNAARTAHAPSPRTQCPHLASIHQEAHQRQLMPAGRLAGGGACVFVCLLALLGLVAVRRAPRGAPAQALRGGAFKSSWGAMGGRRRGLTRCAARARAPAARSALSLVRSLWRLGG